MQGEDDAEGWLTHSLRFDKKSAMAEEAGHYDSFDPLRHGGDDTKANAKIRERQRVMLAMKSGEDVDSFVPPDD